MHTCRRDDDKELVNLRDSANSGSAGRNRTGANGSASASDQQDLSWEYLLALGVLESQLALHLSPFPDTIRSIHNGLLIVEIQAALLSSALVRLLYCLRVTGSALPVGPRAAPLHERTKDLSRSMEK
eukprot:gene29660-5078_t